MAEPTATRQFVRNPAVRCRHCRTAPTTAPNKSAMTRRIANAYQAIVPSTPRIVPYKSVSEKKSTRPCESATVTASDARLGTLEEQLLLGALTTEFKEKSIASHPCISRKSSYHCLDENCLQHSR
jgi:hypothetical protein